MQPPEGRRLASKSVALCRWSPRTRRDPGVAALAAERTDSRLRWNDAGWGPRAYEGARFVLLSIERSDDMRRRVGHPVPKIVGDRDVASEAHSNCLAGQLGTSNGFQLQRSRSIVFRITSNLRMQAVNASFAGFPASRSRV